MLSAKQVGVYRFIESGFLFLLFFTVVISTSFTVLGILDPTHTYLAGGIMILEIGVMYFARRKIQAWEKELVSQTSFFKNEAFSSLFERSPVAYVVINKDGTVNTCNPAAVNLLGGSIDGMKGIKFFELIEENDKVNANVLEGKVFSGVTINDVELPLKMIDNQNSVVWVMLSVYAYQNEGQRLISLIDVTEQKKVDTAKSEFVALATHQLRTPISAIRWNMELLQRNMKDTKTEDQNRYMSKIDRNVIRMINLINDFLSVSKLEMGTYARKEESVNLTEFLDGILDEFAEKLTEKKLKLDRVESPPQATIRIDGRLFHIITSNLVSNAVKYMKPEGTLELSYTLKDEQFEFVVADDGIGIPAKEIENLFTKFYRASNAQSHQTEGTGLGLYVVKQSVEILNGTIEVESAEDQGARFIVRIPVTVVSRQ